MKSLKILLILLTFSFSLKGQIINGTIINGQRNENIPYTEVVIYDSTKTAINNQFTDYDGKFMFINLKKDIYSIYITNLRFGDTTFKNIRIDRDTTMIFDIGKPCRYDKSLKNKKCPVCNKEDEVIPIVYGFVETEPIIGFVGKEKGNPKEGPGVTFILGGCMVSDCDPHWYCKRDKLKF